MLDRKHADFEVAFWGEFGQSPRAAAVGLRPVGFRPDAFRAQPLRPGGAIGALGGQQSLRPTGLRDGGFRPQFFRPERDSGWVVQRQDPAGRFPDRPAKLPGIGSPGTGVAVLTSAGRDSRFVEHDLGCLLPVVHTRVLLNPGTLGGGAIVIIVGMDETSVETFRLSYDAVSWQVVVDLATGEMLTATLLDGLARGTVSNWGSIRARGRRRCGSTGGALIPSRAHWPRWRRSGFGWVGLKRT